jgi:hypothetical protein
MDSNDKSLIWERDNRAVGVCIILGTQTLLDIKCTIFSCDSGLFLQSFKDLLFVRFIADINGILKSVLVINRYILGCSSRYGIMMLDYTDLIEQIRGGSHDFFDLSVCSILINNLSSKHLILSVK